VIFSEGLHHLRLLVRYLARKGFLGVVSDTDLVATLGSDTMSSRSVARFLHEAKSPPSSPSVTFVEWRPEFNNSNEVIFLALAEQPFASIHQ
jgi:hypothetical protein